MRSFLDFEGKSVEKAVQLACNELNISVEKLKYDIISHGSSGIFGLVGTKKALIRVFVADKSLAYAQSTESDKNKSKSNNEPSNKDTINALVDEAFGEIKKPVKPSKPVKPRKPVRPDKPSKALEEKKIKPAQAQPVADETAALTVAQELAEKIFKTLSIDADMTTNNDADQWWIKVKATEPGILIGKKGQTLEAIQYLIDKVVNKQCGKGNQIIIDVEGYVETRKAELKDLASRLAKKASKTGKPSTMSRMNAHDRRVVHVMLKNNRSVRTQSVGEGYYRKLIIFPKKTGKKRHRQENKK
jgi:spoIIIJ-associated protein